jgi:hypothetical protein
MALHDEITAWFEHDERHRELRLRVPATVAADVIAWARKEGYLAKQSGEVLVVKKASRFVLSA